MDRSFGGGEPQIWPGQDYYIHGRRTQKYGKIMSRLILEMSITSEIINRF